MIDIYKWQHKKTKKIFKVVPWWEVLKSDEFLNQDNFDIKIGNKKIKTKYKFGALTQIGWLLENEHGIFIGFGLKAEKEFKKLGQWEVKK